MSMSFARIRSALRGAKHGSIIGTACWGGALIGTFSSLVVSTLAITGYSIKRLFEDNSFSNSDRIIEDACNKYQFTAYDCSFSAGNIIRYATCNCFVLDTGKDASDLKPINEETQAAYNKARSNDWSKMDSDIRSFARDFTTYAVVIGVCAGFVIGGITGAIIGFCSSNTEQASKDDSFSDARYIKINDAPMTQSPSRMYSVKSNNPNAADLSTNHARFSATVS